MAAADRIANGKSLDVVSQMACKQGEQRRTKPASDFAAASTACAQRSDRNHRAPRPTTAARAFGNHLQILTMAHRLPYPSKPAPHRAGTARPRMRPLTLCQPMRDIANQTQRATLVTLAITWLATTAAGQTTVGWSQGSTSGPSARWGHAMAYDAQRDRTFLFGGVTNGSPAWEWDGRNWSFVSAPGPVARQSHAMAFDSLRNCIVMFGGFDSAGPQRLADTWEWNGTSWSMRAYQSIAPLHDHALAFDPQRGRTVLFGGYGGFEFGETWEWDGVAWLQRSTTGPQARHAHGMTFHASQGHVILFGGIQGGTTLGDTWSWNGTQWTQIASTGPAPRYAHAMAYDSLRSRTVLFGGATTASPGILGDTWEWNGTTWSPAVVSASAPTARSEHAMCWHPSSGAMVLFGGISGMPTSDTWLYGAEATAAGTAYGSACGAPRPQRSRVPSAARRLVRATAARFPSRQSPRKGLRRQLGCQKKSQDAGLCEGRGFGRECFFFFKKFVSTSQRRPPTKGAPLCRSEPPWLRYLCSTWGLAAWHRRLSK